MEFCAAAMLNRKLRKMEIEHFMIKVFVSDYFCPGSKDSIVFAQM
jgi:hypothetical protein